jgi:hypothetical protein
MKLLIIPMKQHFDTIPFSSSPCMAVSSAYLAFAGTSPSLGVPPLDLSIGLGVLLQQQQQQQHQPLPSARALQRRKRHFSLEEYQSEDSNLSSISGPVDNTGGACEYEEDANNSMLMSFRKSGEQKRKTNDFLEKRCHTFVAGWMEFANIEHVKSHRYS